uniref:Uncharacterized protein n=1 Tax=Sphaerodactylus townsendi TaxID=933632 RepID=A0ACB8GB39_9SAUR
MKDTDLMINKQNVLILMNVLRLPNFVPLGAVKIQKEASSAFARQASWPMNKEQTVLVTTKFDKMNTN